MYGYSYSSSYSYKPPPTAEENLAEYRAAYPSSAGGELDDETLTANVEFQCGRAAADQRNNFHISDFHAGGEFHRDYDKLESMHDYIQWIFPISEKSPFNASAQVLQRHECATIAASPTGVANSLASFEMMLQFYGMRIVDRAAGTVGRVADAALCTERYANLNLKAHNYRRITRICKYLGEIGLDALQHGWLRFMVQDVFGRNQLPAVRKSLEEWWVPTLKDDAQRAALTAAIAAHKAYLLDPVFFFAAEDAPPHALSDSAADVGAKVDVWWPKDAAWYRGRITAFSQYSKEHTVTYDDGDVRKHYALASCYAVRVAAAVPLDERDAFLEAHAAAAGGVEEYTLPAVLTAPPPPLPRAADVAEEACAPPLAPKEAYAVGEPVAVVHPTLASKWRPGVVSAVPAGTAATGAAGIERTGCTVVFDEDGSVESGVPLAAMRPIREPFPVACEVKALKLAKGRYFEKAVVKERLADGRYTLSFGYSPLYQTVKVVAPAQIERPPIPIDLEEIPRWRAHLPALRAAGAALAPPAVVSVRAESGALVAVLEGSVVPCLSRAELEARIAASDDVEAEVTVGALKSLVDHRMHVASASAVADARLKLPPPPGRIARAAPASEAQHRLEVRLAARAERIAAKRAAEAEAQAAGNPDAAAAAAAAAAEEAAAAAAAAEAVEEEEEDIATEVTLSFPKAYGGGRGAATVPLGWVVDASFASPDLASAYSRGGPGSGVGRAAAAPLAVGDAVLRYVGRTYGASANWEVGRVEAIGAGTAGGARPAASDALNGIVRLWHGDITRLRVDAIQNAANAQLSAGGGICGAIHKGAGPDLALACKTIGDEPTKAARPAKAKAGAAGYGGYLTTRCPEGETRVTRGFKVRALRSPALTLAAGGCSPAQSYHPAALLPSSLTHARSRALSPTRDVFRSSARSTSSTPSVQRGRSQPRCAQRTDPRSTQRRTEASAPSRCAPSRRESTATR